MQVNSSKIHFLLTLLSILFEADFNTFFHNKAVATDWGANAVNVFYLSRGKYDMFDI